MLKWNSFWTKFHLRDQFAYPKIICKVMLKKSVYKYITFLCLTKKIKTYKYTKTEDVAPTRRKHVSQRSEIFVGIWNTILQARSI
jgi:hypothetical protein